MMTDADDNPPVRLVISHGAGRRGVRVGHRLADIDSRGPLPFHGILSRAMLDAMTHLGGAGPAQWSHVAPLLEEALNALTLPGADRSSLKHLMGAVANCRHSSGLLYGAAPVAGLNDASILDWIAHAVEQRVLTYAQSVAAAWSFIERQLSETPATLAEFYGRVGGGEFPIAKPEECELWGVREGHTSSVWRVELRARGWPAPLVFGLYVARDAEAAREQASTTRELRQLRALDPSSVVEILAEADVVVETAGGPATVHAAAVSWMDDARELHVIRRPGEETGRFLKVDHFSTPEGLVPFGQQAPIGEVFDAHESDALWAGHLRRCVKFTSFTTNAFTAQIPIFELNDGDLVWAGGQARVVGVSEPEAPLSLGAWVTRLLLLSAHDEEAHARRIYWNAPQRALDELAAATSEQRPGRPSFGECLSAARELSEAAYRAGLQFCDLDFPFAWRQARTALNERAFA